MARQELDKGSKWLIQKHGNSVLFLGGWRDVQRSRPLQAELVQQVRLPDGLLEVWAQGQRKPQRILLEAATYPDKRVLRQIRDDLFLSALHLGELPELLVLVLHPKGQAQVPNQHVWQSPKGRTKLAGEWNRVELWKLPAEELLAVPDVGLTPWIVLTEYQGPPEILLEKCRDRIQTTAHPDERNNLFVISQIFARLCYPDPDLLAILGGKQVMIESPLIKELLAEKAQDCILLVLKGKFNEVPLEVEKRLRRISNQKRLDNLIQEAGRCSSLKAFQDHLLAK
jgi:hypothetical protein